jgi:acetyltransferase-like isoleucine patch superfamily enzyme
VIRSIKKIACKDSEVGEKANVSLFSRVYGSKVQDFAAVSRFSTIRNSNIGMFSSIGENTRIRDSTVGCFCAISWNVTINAVGHPTDHLSISAFPYYPQLGNFVTKDTRKRVLCNIGNDVWIGANVVVMPGVTIENGAVIGAGSIVTNDVGAYEIWLGSPARFVRYRYECRIVERMRSLPWWHLSLETIFQNIELFNRPVDDEILDQIQFLIDN